MLGWKDPSYSSASAGFPWITTTTTPFSLWLGKGFLCTLSFRLGELQGPLPKLFVKKPSKGRTILSRVLDIVMNPTKQWILYFFLSRWPRYSEWSNNFFSNPFIQNMVQLFCSTRDYRWFLSHFSFRSLSFFSYGSCHGLGYWNSLCLYG